MAKSKEGGPLQVCITCKSPRAEASKKLESSSFNGWYREMSCIKCGLKWKQLFYRGSPVVGSNPFPGEL